MILSEKLSEFAAMPARLAEEHRSPCPIACTLDLIGDKWTLLVVRDLFLGRTQFKEFRASPEGIATNILTDRLGKLVEAGLAEKVVPNDGGKRATYRLTKRGRSLGPVLETVKSWGLDNIPGTAAKLKPKKSPTG